MSSPPIPLLDTHQHLVYADRWPYSWTAGIPALAAKSFTYNDYLRAIEGAGIAAAIFMETSPDDPHWREETRHVAQIAASSDSLIAGMIVNGRPEDEGFENYLDSLDGFLVVGLRRILHLMPDEVSQQPRFVRNVRLLAARGWTFDICMLQRQLPLAAELARACPDVQFVLDHCGVPDMGDCPDFRELPRAAGPTDPDHENGTVPFAVRPKLADWRQKIAAVAALPNVACKISGIMAYCRPGEATAAAIRPYVEHCLDVFGWDRVVWGSDWPVCLINVSLTRWAEITRELIAAESDENQRKLCYSNAIRIYRLSNADPKAWKIR